MAEQTGATPEKPNISWKIWVDTIASWPWQRKLALAGAAVITLGLFSFIIIQARVADYQLLYGNLAESDASAVVEKLKGQNVPYKLANNGRNILVPASHVYEMRLSLASSGLPQGSGVGYEIFDKQSFALTDFVQKVNYSRALQGELARTISSLGPVESARVHLALPEKRLFKDQQKPATASVILKLASGRRLNESQVEGIVHLVSNSIEGLAPGQVTVIDQNGNVLSRMGEKGTAGFSPDMLEYQMQVEQRLEERAQTLLNKSLGGKNSMVRVSATLDFSRTEKTEESYNPDEQVVRSEQLSEEKSGSEITGGVPGVQANLEGNANAVAGATPPSARTQRTTNYEISKVVSKITNPVGSISKLSVSVLVADKVIPAKGKDPAKTEPRTEAELKSLEALVASALGLNPTRGDKIEVASMPFLDTTTEAIEGEGKASDKLYQFMPLIRYALLALGGLLLYYLFIRPIMTTLKKDVTQHYKTVQQMEAEQGMTTGMHGKPGSNIFGGKAYKAAMESPPKDQLEKIRKGVENDPVFSAHVLKGWLHEQQ